MASGWMRTQINEFLALKDQVIRSWSGVEMAVRGGDGPTPEFTGQDVPCLHLRALHARTDTGDTVTIATYQHDDLFGLRIERSAGADGDDVSHGYRRRALPELPTGLVQRVSIDLDGDVLAEVRLQVERRDLLLVAGEAEENFEDRLVWRRLDESVLAFTDANTVERMKWVPARRRLQRIT
ncbi:hypothetical protein [Micromonospora chersina]|uniref:hypothetical protein n=1 Tax=Micromonospora chersina TaxID=47854 RepID=UPI0033A8AD27